MKKIILFLLIILLNISGKANNDTTSLRINSIKDDTLRAMAWYRAGFKYSYSDTAKAGKYSRECFNLSQKAHFTNGLIASYHLMGEIAEKSGSYDLAIECFNKSLDICLFIKDRKSAAKRYNNLASVYHSKGDYKTCTDYYMKCIKIFEEIGNKQGMAYAYIGLSNIFSEQNNEEKALEYITKGLTISEEINDSLGIASALNNQGMIFGHRGEHQKQIANYTKALEIKDRLGDKRGVAENYSRLAEAHSMLGDNKKAHELLELCLKMFEELGDKENIAVGYTNIGEQYYNEGNYAKAKENYLKGLERAKELKFILLIQHIYNSLSKTYEKYGDYKNAYQYHLLYTQVKDSVLNKESSKQVAEMETKYQTEKKALQIINLKNEKALQQSEIEKQSAEAKRQNIQKMAFAGGFVLMFVLAFVVYRGYANKKRSNEIITAQKREVEFQRDIIEEKQKEIIDSIYYARRIQKSLLPTEKYIHKVFSRLRKG